MKNSVENNKRYASGSRAVMAKIARIVDAQIISNIQQWIKLRGDYMSFEAESLWQDTIIAAKIDHWKEVDLRKAYNEGFRSIINEREERIRKHIKDIAQNGMRIEIMF